MTDSLEGKLIIPTDAQITPDKRRLTTSDQRIRFYVRPVQKCVCVKTNMAWKPFVYVCLIALLYQFKHTAAQGCLCPITLHLPAHNYDMRVRTRWGWGGGVQSQSAKVTSVICSGGERSWLLNRTSDHVTCPRHCRLLFLVGGKHHQPSFEYSNAAHENPTHFTDLLKYIINLSKPGVCCSKVKPLNFRNPECD